MGVLGDFIEGFFEGVNGNGNQGITVSSQSNAPQGDRGGYTISSLQEMSQWLNTLQKGASPAVREALNAQVNVIRFVQSPTLVDTTFDTLLYSLDKSLRVARNQEEVSGIREVFCLMVQNYVFFMDAKYQMEINKNREEGRQLFIEAGEMLSNCIKDVALMAVGGADASAIANTTITNLFAPENGQGGISGFLNRLFNYINQEDILFEQQQQFYVTIENIIIKLGEPDTQQLLGKSNLLAGTIKRYVPGLRDFCFTYNTTINSAQAALNKNLSNGAIISSVWVSLSLLWAFLRWGVYYPIAGPAPEGWFGRQMLWTVGILAGIIIFFWAIGLGDRSAKKKQIKEYTDYFNGLFSIAEAYKEHFDYQKTANQPIIVETTTKDGEDEYLKEVQFMLEDGEIGARERKTLERIRVRLGLSESRAAEIEASVVTPNFTSIEKEYYDEVKAVLEDGEIQSKERKYLERIRTRLGISEERAKEIERLC